MDGPGLLEVAKAANQVGLVGLLAAIIVTGIKGMWVPGFAYREKKSERDQALVDLARFVGIHETQTRAMEELREEFQALKLIVDQQRRGRG